MAASKRYPVAQAHCLFNIYIQYVARCENSLINVSVYIQSNIFMQIFWMNYCHSLAFIFKARVHSAAEHSQTPIPIPRPNGPWLSGWLAARLCKWNGVVPLDLYVCETRVQMYGCDTSAMANQKPTFTYITYTPLRGLYMGMCCLKLRSVGLSFAEWMKAVSVVCRSIPTYGYQRFEWTNEQPLIANLKLHIVSEYDMHGCIDGWMDG